MISVYIRLFSYLLGITMVIFAIHPEKVYRKVSFLSAFVGYADRFAVDGPCTEIMVGAIFLPLVVTGPFAALTALLGLSLAKTNIHRLLIIVEAAACFFIVIYSWVPVQILLMNLQFKAL